MSSQGGVEKVPSLFGGAPSPGGIERAAETSKRAAEGSSKTQATGLGPGIATCLPGQTENRKQ